MSESIDIEENLFEDPENSVVNPREILANNPMKKKSRRRKMFWLLGVLIILGLGGWGLYKWLGTSSSTSFLTMPAAKATVTDSIQATGTLNPVKKAALGFKNNGNIIALNVQPGDRVKQGQVLALQDPTSLQAALRQAESQLTQDQIAIQNQQIVADAATRTLDQQQNLFDAGALAKSDLDQTRDAYNKSQLDLKNYQARLANDQAKAAQSQSDLEGATLTAPFDGVVGTVNGQVGQINGYGSNGNTLLDVISDDLELSALVNEVDMGRIQVGQNVEFTTSAYANKTFRGKVERVNPEASTVSNVQYYPVLISCIDPGRQLRAGMSATVNIIIARKSNVLTVPMMAVSYAQSYIRNNQNSSTQAGGSRNRQTSSSGTRSNGSNASTGYSGGSSQHQGRRAAILVLENNQAVKKTVTLGLSDGQNYEVMEGVKEGDKIIVGSTQSDSQSTSSGSNSNSRSQQQNRSSSPFTGGGGMMRVRGN